ncbi:MAG: lysophospholipid transporter LplT [Betaproteobacteria bacterium]|nr:lysophospholipid transporter LplT [Betaproteobacteria bacterium]
MPDGEKDAPLYDTLLTRGMVAVLVAQFVSAFADNALFVAGIASLKTLPHGVELTSALQEVFVVAYILLAPFVGPFADALPKGRVMLLSNALKFVGAWMMLAGFGTLAGYSIVGIGAAAYSPAKYGILAQFYAPERLVQANGLLESSTIVAILLGVLAGGIVADHSLPAAFEFVLALYFAAGIVNLAIPRVRVERPLHRGAMGAAVRAFWGVTKRLWQNPDARFSMLGTSTFWGTGTTLRLMLFAWVPAALAIRNNEMPSLMMAVVSVGIIAGAALAGWHVNLARANRALLGGVLIGPLVIVLSLVHTLGLALAVLALLGLCGGVFVIPLNALLQDRGHRLVGAGHALAIQNFAENSAMLLFVGLYMSISRLGWPVARVVAVFGAVVLIAIAWLTVRRLAASRG